MRHPHIHSKGLLHIIQVYQFNTLDTVFTPNLYTTSNTPVTLHFSRANTKAGDSTSTVNSHYSKSYTHFTETNPAKYQELKRSTDMEFDALIQSLLTSSNKQRIKTLQKQLCFPQFPTSRSCMMMLLVIILKVVPLTFAESSIKLLPLLGNYYCTLYPRLFSWNTLLKIPLHPVV